MMRSGAFRIGCRITSAMLAVTIASATPHPAAAHQADSRVKVLVAPLAAERGASEGFGRRVAEEVRDRLDGMPALTAIGEEALEDALDRLEPEDDELSRVEWRQLADHLEADLLLYGTITRVGRGHLVRVSLIDVRSGDTADVPEFTIEEDGGRGVREAADRIVDAMQSQVEYQRAALICSDYLASQQYEDAARNCRQAIELRPNSTTARYLIGRIEIGRENWQAAKESLDMVVEANPAHVDALNSLAYTEAKLGNTERARELYDEYLGFNPDAADVRMQIAYDLARAGDYEGAVELLRDGLTRDPSNADMWKFLGDVLLNQGTARDSAPADPGDPQLAEAEVRDEEAIRGAIEAYDRVLELRGAETDPQILKNVVAGHLRLGEIPEAKRFAERAEQRLPEDASLRSLKADVLARQEDYAGAVAAMDEALRLDPALPRGLARRGIFKLSAGDEKDAMSDFRAAVETGEAPDIIAQQMLARGHERYYRTARYDRAARVFDAALEFAEAPTTEQQLHFFAAASYYQAGAAIDAANEEEACGPARRALDRFREVLPHLDQAADFQAGSQDEIRNATDVHLYRQQAILEKPACR